MGSRISEGCLDQYIFRNRDFVHHPTVDITCVVIIINQQKFRVFGPTVVKTCQSRPEPCEPQLEHNILHQEIDCMQITVHFCLVRHRPTLRYCCESPRPGSSFFDPVLHMSQIPFNELSSYEVRRLIRA